jgi:hypothetical protein
MPASARSRGSSARRLSNSFLEVLGLGAYLFADNFVQVTLTSLSQTGSGRARQR